jgi:CxxC motif-containing protein (DUF1111 family)
MQSLFVHLKPDNLIIMACKQIQLISLTLLLSQIIIGCDSDDNSSKYPDYALVENLGDTATAENSSNSGHGFSTPIPTLTDDELAQHLTGDVHFETAFTTAPNTEHPELDGLGPVFNNQDCNSCHQRDGRPSTVTLSADQDRVLLGSSAGIFLRMSIEDGLCEYPDEDNDYCNNVGVDGFGTQLFHRGVLKARDDWNAQSPETANPFIGQANVYLSYESSTFTYPDGTSVELKKPLFDIEIPYDVESDDQTSSTIMQDNVRFSPRNGMPVFGLGLLELIPESDILALEDTTDENADGISGRANWVFDPIKARDGDDTPISLGRFGWKASTPSVRVQSLGALRGDMGITNPLFPDESIANTSMHESYLTRTNNEDTGTDIYGDTEASQSFSDDVVFYAETLAVPARRNIDDEDVLAGSILFEQSQCTACHTPSFTTQTGELSIGGKDAPEALKGQKIYPFTDMLLHNMGDELADNRRDFMADGFEWKTRPLWGIGLTKTVNPAAGFLHDGRAGSVEEAILWHGGEAANSRTLFANLTSEQRSQLVSFVMSL